nr:MAG TPA: hypothetical protein [Caudoviricetes sp.]
MSEYSHRGRKNGIKRGRWLQVGCKWVTSGLHKNYR